MSQIETIMFDWKGAVVLRQHVYACLPSSWVPTLRQRRAAGLALFFSALAAGQAGSPGKILKYYKSLNSWQARMLGFRGRKGKFPTGPTLRDILLAVSTIPSALLEEMMITWRDGSTIHQGDVELIIKINAGKWCGFPELVNRLNPLIPCLLQKARYLSPLADYADLYGGAWPTGWFFRAEQGQQQVVVFNSAATGRPSRANLLTL